jgi:hypothetical protein
MQFEPTMPTETPKVGAIHAAQAVKRGALSLTAFLHP